ncbi:hypothetical protein PM082_021648 [Marasmius tenuissimus]|nr:hypothetical protein PM082_021648 [Marasmius tenuissimus]
MGISMNWDNTLDQMTLTHTRFNNSIHCSVYRWTTYFGKVLGESPFVRTVYYGRASDSELDMLLALLNLHSRPPKKTSTSDGPLSSSSYLESFASKSLLSYAKSEYLSFSFELSKTSTRRAIFTLKTGPVVIAML